MRDANIERIERLEVLVWALLQVTQTGTLDHRLAALHVLDEAREETPISIIQIAKRLWRDLSRPAKD
jgi:hypothetical protein